MSSVGDREQRLILDLLLGHKSEEQFCQEFPADPLQKSALGLSILQTAAKERDPVGVEFGLHLGHRFGFLPEYLGTLLALLREDWHERHEDVVDGLAELKSPESVDALCYAALMELPYRSYDDSGSLAKKCIRLLGKLQSHEAVLRLADLVRRGSDSVRSAAAAELHRLELQGHSHSVRLAARNVLRG